MSETPDAEMARYASEQGVAVTVEHRRASRFLERRGRRFLVHYGFLNVIDKAREEWRKLRKARDRV